MSEPRREYRKVATVLAEQATAGGTIQTLEGEMTFEAGDYICGPGQAGEFWPVKRSIFEATYVPVEAEAAAQAEPTIEPGMCECGQDMDAHAGGFALLHHDEFMAAQAGDLDAAWREAEEALPEGWTLYGVANLHRVYADGPWEARADSHTVGSDVVRGRGPTPADALRALTARLRERSE